MSDHPQIQVRHLGELNVSDDDWLRVFAFIGPAELVLKLALLSARFDGLVDLHFESRKWILGDFEVRRSLDGSGAAEIVKETEDGTSDHLPLPQGQPPANVVGFICISIHFIDRNVVDFLKRIRRLFNVELTLELNASFNEYSDWITLITDIWPLLAPNVHRLLTFDDNLYQLRKLVSPTVLRDCAKLRAFHSVDLLPKGPADDRDRAYNEQALSKWLHSPREDGRPNIFECLDWLEAPELVLEALKQTFLVATSPANYAIVLRSLHFDSDVDFEQFELVNGKTREKLALRRVRDDIWMMKRGPSAGDEEQWAALEREAVEEWERNNLVVIEIGGDVE
uniref:F-box domain-containing protein n=1 Tax=Globodera pallida TaxID=36090 RepID=A0A183BUL4_GLOPA